MHEFALLILETLTGVIILSSLSSVVLGYPLLMLYLAKRLGFGWFTTRRIIYGTLLAGLALLFLSTAFPATSHRKLSDSDRMCMDLFYLTASLPYLVLLITVATRWVLRGKTRSC